MRRLTLLVLVIALALAGCAAPRKTQPAPLANPGPTTPPEASPKPSAAKATINLYFPDNQAEKLLVEKREVEQPAPVPPQLIIDQLIRGPVTNSQAVNLIPRGTTAKVSQEGDLVTVDFNGEIKKANLGSSGEALLINSILACLFEIPTIQHVQILIDGKQTETLAGHVDISKPLARRAK
ncbi:MAG: GerMN domain-containing protein [Bacillota bacterium]